MPEKTEKEPPHSLPPTFDGTEALIFAFPPARAVPVPSSGETIGREWARGNSPPDGKISGNHLRFIRQKEDLFVEDVGSTNGTFVNGDVLRKGHPTPVKDGTVIRLGNSVLVYRRRLLQHPGTASPFDPAPAIGNVLVGPYGLRSLALRLDGLQRWPPRCVLIQGETGSGKEFLATIVHTKLRPGSSSGQPVSVNVSAIHGELFASEMFGYKRGAFTGAIRDSLGYVGQANAEKGSIFLDEIGDLAPDHQVKLLRLLENLEIQRVGANQAEKVDVLVIAATHRELSKLTASDSGKPPHFRSDLAYRLNQEILRLPALADRKEDIPAITYRLFERARQATPQVEVEAIERLMLNPWPGNVRELDAVLGRAIRSGPGGILSSWAVDQAIGAPNFRQGQRILQG